PETTTTPNMYSVVVSYVPVTAQLDDPSTLRSIEASNGLGAHTIREAKWIKAIGRRNPGQMYAMAELWCINPEIANSMIRDGISVMGRTTTARKPLPEPRRCLKCQQFRGNHMARDCKKPTETCARCAQEHRTEECTTTGAHEMMCANCGENGHGAADKNC